MQCVAHSTSSSRCPFLGRVWGEVFEGVLGLIVSFRLASSMQVPLGASGSMLT